MYIYQKLLIILGIVMPFSFALSPTATIDLNILKIFIPIVFLFWLASSLLRKTILLDNRLRFWLLLIFLLIVFLSFFWTPAPKSALRKILFLLSTALIYPSFYAASFSAVFVNKFLKNLIFGAFLVACVSLIFFLLQFIIGLDPTLHILRIYTMPVFLGDSLSILVNQYSSWLVNIAGTTILRTFGTFPDPHLFSLYLSMLLPINIYLYKQLAQKKYLVFFAVMLLAVLLSFSRSAYLAIIIGFMFLLFNSISQSLFKKKILLMYITFISLLFLVIIPNPLTLRLQSSFNLQEGSNSGRIEMWETAWTLIKENPYWGVGLGGFAETLNSALGIRNPIYAHNLFLDFGAETGIVNAFILLMLLLCPILFFLNYKSINSSDNLSKFIATSFVIFFISSLFETPFFSVRVFPLFLILLAIKIPSNKLIPK